MIFKDSHASIGRIKPIIHDKTIIPATSPSRSLASLISNKTIKIEILDNGYLIIDFSSVIGTKARINQTNAKKLAAYILEVYAGRSRKKPLKKTLLDRKS